MRIPVLLLAGLACACADAGGNADRGPPAGSLPPNAAILNGAAVPDMLRQCSRGAPAAGEGTWQPAPSNILALEAALPAALAAQRRPGPDWSRAPEGWQRQYVGILRGGRRFIYGNFVPSEDSSASGRWQQMPTRICDGGPAFFGVEYDVAAGRFTHFAFNGSLRPPPS